MQGGASERTEGFTPHSENLLEVACLAALCSRVASFTSKLPLDTLPVKRKGVMEDKFFDLRSGFCAHTAIHMVIRRGLALLSMVFL